MLLSRRSFLGFIAAAVAAGAIVPAMQETRKPYITMQDGTADYIGHCPGGFIGAQLIQKIHEWDGHGYPVDLRDNCAGLKHSKLERYYDFDLANFRREVPDDFWHHAENRKRYNNVHTWLRTQRFGESIERAVAHLNLQSAGLYDARNAA